MKKVELVEAIAEKAGVTKADANRCLDAFVEVVSKALAKGTKVPVSGLGTFAPSKRAAREGRNPQTGATVKIAARTAVTFKASKALKETVNK